MWSALTYTCEHSSEFRALTTALLSSTQPHRLAMSFMATRATDKQHMGQGQEYRRNTAYPANSNSDLTFKELRDSVSIPVSPQSCPDNSASL